MRVACPDCETPQEAEPGEVVVCPACMTRYEAPATAQVPRRFDLHLPDGTILARQTHHAVRELIYTGRVPVTSRMRPDVGVDELVPVYEYPPFAAIYNLLNVEPPVSAGTRRIAGWAGKRVAPQPLVGSAPPPVSRQEATRTFFRTASIPVVLAIGVGAFLALLVLVAMFVGW